MNDRTVDLSIVIVSYNVADLLDECLCSIKRTAGDITYQIIVVDNQSRDHTVQLITTKHKDVTLVVNDHNAGFAKANNQGFQLATGRCVFVLNPDTVLQEQCLSILMKGLGEDPEVGAVGPKTLRSQGAMERDCARKAVSRKAELLIDVLRMDRMWGVRRYALRARYPYDYETDCVVEAISGAAMLVRREVLQAVGGFDADYLHGGEDVDLCMRIRRAGYKVKYMQAARMTHYVNSSGRQDNVNTRVKAALSHSALLNKHNMRWLGSVYRVSLIAQAFAGVCGECLKMVVFRFDRHAAREKMSLFLNYARYLA